MKKIVTLTLIVVMAGILTACVPAQNPKSIDGAGNNQTAPAGGPTDNNTPAPDTTDTDEPAQPKIDLEADAELIKQALITQRKLNLTGMKVTLRIDTGVYASGGVVPIDDTVVGGGYVFAAKVDGAWKIVADGNGQIDCVKLDPYPDFPNDMIGECVESNGTMRKR